MILRRTLLFCGVLFPIVYGAALAMGSAANPGYSDIAQVPSDLGRQESALSALFNAGLIASGMFGALGGAGLALGFHAAAPAGRGLAGIGAGLCWVLFALSLVIAGLFPLPSPRHTEGDLVLAGLLTPLLSALAVRPLPGGGRVLHAALLCVFLLILVLILGTLGGLVPAADLGAVIRALAVLLFGAAAAATVFLLRQEDPGGRSSPPLSAGARRPA